MPRVYDPQMGGTPEEGKTYAVYPPSVARIPVVWEGDGRRLCVSCAWGERVERGYLYREGPPLTCDGCGATLESERGEPVADGTDAAD